MGIAHTRWATHGPPTDANAHPHISQDGLLAVVHNGIVENFKALREELVRKGYTMRSDTDTELIAHLISDVRRQKWMPLEEAVRQAMTQVHGAFGIAVMCADEPEMMIGARKGSPLILGIGSDEYILASDAAAVIERTKQVSYLQDGEMVIINRKGGYQIKTLDNVQLIREVQELELSLQEIQKGAHTALYVEGDYGAAGGDGEYDAREDKRRGVPGQDGRAQSRDAKDIIGEPHLDMCVRHLVACGPCW